MEIWMDVIDYEGIYQVSNMGNIKSLDRIDASGHNRKGKPMAQKIKKNGYHEVILCKNSIIKHSLLHRLILLTFNPIENSENLQVNHIDGNKSNNCLENLEWVTNKENIQHALNIGLKGRTPNAKLTKEDIEYIKENYVEGSRECGSTALGRKLGVHKTTILRALKR